MNKFKEIKECIQTASSLKHWLATGGKNGVTPATRASGDSMLLPSLILVKADT